MLALFLPLLTCGFLLLNACAPAPPMNTPAPPATALVPLPPATASARVYAALQKAEVPLQVLTHPELGPMFSNFVLYDNKQSRIDNGFRVRPEGDYSEKVYPLTLANQPPVTITPALQAYVALPEADRAADLLMSIGRDYWPSPDYQRGGQPLPYSCDFILHFGPANGGTLLEVIALGSRIQDGKEWRIAADQDGLGIPRPRRLPRVRNVAPAPHENQAVLAQLVKLLQ